MIKTQRRKVKNYFAFLLFTLKNSASLR